MSKFDNIQIPDNIDEITTKAIKRGIDYKRKRKYKKIGAASVTILVIGTGIIGIGITNPSIADSIPILKNIAEYFNNNNNSIYKQDKDEFERIGEEVNISVKDKGIELILDSVSADDNYIAIFYTIKSDKNIKEMNNVHSNPYFANPIIYAYIDYEEDTNSHRRGNGLSSELNSSPIESEAKFISGKELKGMHKIDISHMDIESGTDVEFYTGEIFGVNGDWSITTKIDKSKATEDTYRYEIDKDFVLDRTIERSGETKKIKSNIDIERIIISPLANKIVINESAEKASSDWEPILTSSFVLFDQDGESLDVIDKGSGWNSDTCVSTNSVEFIKGSKDTKKLTLVPFSFRDDVENKLLDPQRIDKLPITFKTSDSGKIILEDISITDKEIRYTYLKEGLEPFTPNFYFFDEDLNEINISGGITHTSVERKEGRYIGIWDFTDKEITEDFNTSKLKDIRYVSTYTNNDIELLHHQGIEIDLEK